MLTKNERKLRIFLKTLLVIYSISFIYFLTSFFSTAYKPLNAALLINITLLNFINFLFCWYSIADLRKFILLVKIIIWESILSSVIAVFILIWVNTDIVINMFNLSLPLNTCIISFLVFNIIVFTLTLFLLYSAEKAHFNLKYFLPHQFKTLKALAEVVIYGEKEVISSEDVAINIDTYFKTFEAKTKWTMALVVTGLYVYPLLSLKPPLPFISSEDRLVFLKKRFYKDVEARLMPEFWRVIAQGMIRIAKQLCYIGYYNDKRTFASVGYIPFSDRKDFKERLNKFPYKKEPELFVKNENDINQEVIEGDVVVIGSGAAASILAKGLVENGRKVLMVERGNHEKPETFNENEMEMVSRLFKDGAIQAASDFRFTVFQGSCVGGSTVVNNAVCFKMPESVLDKWTSLSELNTGLNKAGVLQSMDKVWSMIHTNHMDENLIRLNPGGYLFKQACEKLGYNAAPNVTDSVNANISGCLGCGYCNIGCQYNKKLSMLTTILPEIQNKHGKDSLEIIAGCEAVKLQKKGNKISYVECEFNSGKKIKIKGKTFVVSAGAISSSILLLKSKLGLKNAGKYLSFNVGSQITAAFSYKIDSYDGLQISHYMKILPDTGFIMESWFNPPMFQSTAMPGWFEDHFNNMKRYDRLACVGVLVGSESNAQVKVAGLTHREIDYTPTPKDFQTLLTGLELAGEIMLEAGAESVMPNTFKYYEFKNKSEVKKLHTYIKDSSEITLGTGHPQGGNIIANSSEKGVVNSEFKAFGYDNLFVCDASVFPTSLGVNPQLAVMGLADYAVQFVKENKG